MAKPKTLLELLQDKIRVLLLAEDMFLESVKATEGSIFSKVSELLRSFTQIDGRLVPDENSTNVMGRIKREVRQILKDSTLPRKVDEFLPSFDQVELLNNKIYGRIVPDVKLPPVGTEKRNNIDKVTRGLKDIRGIEPVFEIPLRQKLFQLVETQTRFTNAVDSLRVFIKGTTPSGGELARYARQIATDLLNGFNGYQEQQIAKENGLDGFFYTGSLIATSRETCIGLSGGIGEYKDLAIRPGLYPVSAIPEIVRRSKDNPGWRPETTPETFAIYRGGYNCRHLLVYVPLTRKERESVLQIQKEIAPIQEFDPKNPGNVIPPAGPPRVPPDPDPNVPGGNLFVWESENDLVPLDKEKGLIFNSTDSDIIWQKGGGVSQIRITRKESELMEGRIFTHNHPSWKKRKGERGSSFSIDEVITSRVKDQGQMSGDIIIAYRNGLKEMRAVSKNDTFIFRPDISGEHWVDGFVGGLDPIDTRSDTLINSRGREYLQTSNKYDFGEVDNLEEYNQRQFARLIYYEKIVRPKMRKGIAAFDKRMKEYNDRINVFRKEKNEYSKEVNNLFDQIDELGGKEVFERGKKLNEKINLVQDKIAELEEERNTFWTHWQMEEIAKEIPGEYIHINESRK